MPDRSIELDAPATEVLRMLYSDGLIRDPAATITPLSGGVSSAIYLVRADNRQFVVKRALPKLKVKQEWLADTSRSGNEAAYISYVARFLPHDVPRLEYVSADHGYFCMEYLGESWQNWKEMMLGGWCDPGVATSAVGLLGKIHARSAQDREARERFQTLANFEQLRIEPYLLATARRHPRLKEILEAEASRLRSARNVLTHGDFSPKNILVSPERLMVVDCECAWYGDAAFDVAFLLSHLFLKSLARPAIGPWQKIVEVAWSSYLASRFADEIQRDDGRDVLDAQVSWLLLMLLLARIDGKSPVEYLQEHQQEHVRSYAIRRLLRGPVSLSKVIAEWFT